MKNAVAAKIETPAIGAEAALSKTQLRQVSQVGEQNIAERNKKVTERGWGPLALLLG